MARRSAVEQLLEQAETHPALRALPAAARWIWIAVARSMMKSGVSVLRFGSAVVSAREIALGLAIGETEWEAAVPVLVERGMLSVEDDGAIACPYLARLITRSEINRINGSKGGRPRKKVADAGQASMLLSIVGGAAEMSAETEKTESESKRYPAATAAQLALFTKEQKDLAREAKSVAGIDGAASVAELRAVAGWMAAGLSREQMLGAIERRPGHCARALVYFEPVMRALVRRDDGMAAGGGNSAWERAYRDWKDGGYVGPLPRLEDYRGTVAA
jgi:hypothetical protein